MAAERSRIRPMEETDLERVLAWRNHPDTRRHLFTSHEISWDEHRRWFEAAGRDPARHLLIFDADGESAGFVSFGPLKAGGIAPWGFYAAPGAPRGTGRKLGFAALEYAFETLGLRRIQGEVLASNEASIRFHRRLGFRQEGVLVEHHFDGERYHDVILFGLLSREWRAAGEGE